MGVFDMSEPLELEIEIEELEQKIAPSDPEIIVDA